MEDVADAWRRRARRWGPAALVAALIFVASSIPGHDAPPTGIFAHDKLVHAVIYFVLGFFCARGAEKPVVGFVVAAVYGALDELHQSFTPGRDADPWDWAADLVGAALGATLFALAAWRMRRSRPDSGPDGR